MAHHLNYFIEQKSAEKRNPNKKSKAKHCEIVIEEIEVITPMSESTAPTKQEHRQSTTNIQANFSSQSATLVEEIENGVRSEAKSAVKKNQ